MGHDEDYQSDNTNKTARGLTSAKLVGIPTSQGTQVTWRLQGTRGGENGLDKVRGPLNTGGLYGERAGWSLPGYPDTDWKPVTLPTSKARAGVTWYRTTAALALPAGQDTSIALDIADDPARHYRAEIYVNGWQLGSYVNDIGPQHTFPIPNGILKTNGQQQHRHRGVGHRRHHRRAREGLAGEPGSRTRRRCRWQRSPAPGTTRPGTPCRRRRRRRPG